MSCRTSCQVLVLVLIAMGVLTLPAFARPQTAFTSTEMTEGPLSGGMMIPLGGNLYMLGATRTTIVKTTDPRISGTATDILYGIFSLADGTGPVWGTVKIENARGAWTGPWQGQITREGTDTISAAQATLVGSGDYAGLIAFWSGRSVNDEPRQATGYIAKGKVNERPMKLNNAVSIVKVDMGFTRWTWLAPNMAVIPWTTDDTGVGTHVGEWDLTASGGTLVELQPDGSSIYTAQWCDAVLTAANGDELFVFVEWPDAGDQTVANATIRGGTGRFANATGSMLWTGDYAPGDWWEDGFHFSIAIGAYEGTITY